MWSLDDTIAAISTPIGEGGIGIVRMSGPQAEAILRKVFRRAGKNLRDARPFEPETHHLYYGHIVDPDTGIVVDEALATLMRAPRTYTRQDVAEIHCHGGIMPLRRTLELMLRHGARLAQPGEFTLRAFLNGRIDLAQAEAVLDIVRAKTEVSLRVAMEQLNGRISGQVRAIRSMLLTAQCRQVESAQCLAPHQPRYRYPYSRDNTRYPGRDPEPARHSIVFSGYSGYQEKHQPDRGIEHRA